MFFPEQSTMHCVAGTGNFVLQRIYMHAHPTHYNYVCKRQTVPLIFTFCRKKNCSNIHKNLHVSKSCKLGDTCTDLPIPITMAAKVSLPHWELLELLPSSQPMLMVSAVAD
jgi:hypothetical protein